MILVYILVGLIIVLGVIYFTIKKKGNAPEAPAQVSETPAMPETPAAPEITPEPSQPVQESQQEPQTQEPTTPTPFSQ